MHRPVQRLAQLLVIAGTFSAASMAQTAAPAAAATPGAPAIRTTGNPAKDNLLRMQVPITQDFNETRLEEVVKYIADNTGVAIETLWKGDRTDGFDRDMLVTMSFKGLPAITVMEKLLALVGAEMGGETTWQFASYGAFQIGPKSEFNKAQYRRVEIYDINDLLFVLPIYDDAPNIDLNQVLRNSGGGRGGGGGGGGSPFQNANQNQRQNRQEDRENEREQRAEGIIALLTAIAEPNQWLTGGGDIPNPRYFQGHIIVDGPDYIHRAVNGYPWWPKIRAGSSNGTGRRYVSFNMETGINKIDSIRNIPVTAVAGGAGGGG